MGLVEDTIVVHTSDHGEMDGQHGLFQKFCLFESSVRVPLIVSCPGRYSEGVVAEALTEYIGLYPTLTEVAGLAPPERTTLVPLEGAPPTVEAASFAQLVSNPRAASSAAVFCEHSLRSDTPQYMVRGERYKYNYNDGGRDELYDLQDDPGQFVNCIDDPVLAPVRENMHRSSPGTP